MVLAFMIILSYTEAVVQIAWTWTRRRLGFERFCLHTNQKAAKRMENLPRNSILWET